MEVNKGLTEEVARLKQIMGLEEKKADRCLRIARRKYDKPSAYRSGSIVRCRQGKIWKDLKEAGELEDFQLHENEELIWMAHSAITRRKGKDYAPDIHELQAWIDEYLKKKSSDEPLIEGLDSKGVITCDNPKCGHKWELADGGDDPFLCHKCGYQNKPTNEADLTEDESLHKWFSRRGGDGNKGWVDCNTCRKVDGRKKCKACGRQKGEKRSKYPSCRPTPSACKTPGKGKKWGKTKNEGISLNEDTSVKRVALLFVVVDNKVLLFKRSPKETTNAGKYGMLGGGIEKGESPQNALKREIQEEAGVTLTSFKPLKKYNYDKVELNVFYTNSFPMDDIKLKKDEHTSYKFFTLEDVMDMTDKEMIQSNKKIARDYNKKVSKKKQIHEEVSNMYDVLRMLGENVIKEETFLGNHVWQHIVDITPNEDDIPWAFKNQIRNAEFDVDNNFDLETLLNTDPDFKEYYESGDERYGEDDDMDESDLYHDIVVVDGELLDGYSRAATLLRNGETRSSAFVGTNKR